MAKQMGILPLSGPMGGISFYKSDGEFRAREKTGPSRKMVLTSRRFERTRENSAEFRRAVRAGMLVRYSLRYLLKVMKLADTHVSGRLHGLLLKVLQSDPVNGRGARTVSKGNLELLEDFAFHKDRTLSQLFPAGPVSSINSTTGRMSVEIRPFDPQQRVQAPAGATHFKVVSVGAAIDFDKECYQEDFRETDYLSLHEAVGEPICLEHVPEAKPGQSLLLAMGIVFYVRNEHGHYERIQGGAMRVLQVAGFTTPEESVNHQVAVLPHKRPLEARRKVTFDLSTAVPQIKSPAGINTVPPWSRFTGINGSPPGCRNDDEPALLNTITDL